MGCQMEFQLQEENRELIYFLKIEYLVKLDSKLLKME